VEMENKKKIWRCFQWRNKNGKKGFYFDLVKCFSPSLPLYFSTVSCYLPLQHMCGEILLSECFCYVCMHTTFIQFLVWWKFIASDEEPDGRSWKVERMRKQHGRSIHVLHKLLFDVFLLILFHKFKNYSPVHSFKAWCHYEDR
jgi:hypothetical protein